MGMLHGGIEALAISLDINLRLLLRPCVEKTEITFYGALQRLSLAEMISAGVRFSHTGSVAANGRLPQPSARN